MTPGDDDVVERLAARFSSRPPRASTPDGYPSDWQERRRRVFERDDWTCTDCGIIGGPGSSVTLHADHVVPVADGGSHELGNLETRCAGCHAGRHGNPTIAKYRQR